MNRIELLRKIKLNLRITHKALDEDIADTIESAIEDLKRVGVDVSHSFNLLEHAIKLYCRWHFNFENQADRYEKSYKNLRNSISLSNTKELFIGNKDV